MSDENNSNNKPKNEVKKVNPLTHLTNRERHFVQELVSEPITATEAARRSYNVTTNKSARNTASRLMQKDSIKTALEYMYNEVWPDAERDVITRLMSIIRDGSDSNAIAAIREVAKMKGYNKPTQKQTLNANITLPGTQK